MKYALGNMLNGYGVRGLDADAKAYIDAVVAAGATVTSTQRNAINAFIKGGKTDGWWSSMKRVYLPIWAIAAPNAIDIVSRTSGTFAGTVTHASGYVQGNGTTGYFSFGVTPSSLGMSTNGGSVFSLVTQQDTRTDVRYFVGVVDSLGRRTYLRQSASTVVETHLYSSIGSVTQSPSSRSGVFLGSVISTTNRYLKRRGSGGVTYTTTSSTSDLVEPSSTQNIFSMAINSTSTPAAHSDARFGAYGAGLGLTSGQGDIFTLALKNVWEACTGSTIPA